MNEYVTGDLQFSSYLQIIGRELVRTEGTRARRLFVFRNVTAEDIADYHRGTRLVEPRALFGAYRELKRRVFDTV
jgi:hypothetical protein